MYTGATIENLTGVAGGSCRFNFTATAGVTYRIVIDLAPGPESVTFDLTLRRFQPPANDDFANAHELSGPNTSASGTMVDSTKEDGDPFSGSVASGTVWFNWTAPASGQAKVDIGENPLLYLAIYTGNALGDLVSVGSSFYSYAFAAEAGTTYRLLVATAYMEPDGFTLTLSLDATLPVRPTLRVTKGGTGEGAVTSSPGGIDCGSRCSAEFDEGKVVTLTASPAPGSSFTGWSGAGCSGTGSCRVTVAADETVKAHFATRPTRPVIRKARIGKLRAGGPGKVRRGQKVTYKIKVSNAGDLVARGLKLRVVGKGVSARSSIGRVPPGQTKAARIKLRFRRSGKVKLVFRVGSVNAGGKTVKRVVVVRK